MHEGITLAVECTTRNFFGSYSREGTLQCCSVRTPTLITSDDGNVFPHCGIDVVCIAFKGLFDSADRDLQHKDQCNHFADLRSGSIQSKGRETADAVAEVRDDIEGVRVLQLTVVEVPFLLFLLSPLFCGVSSKNGEIALPFLPPLSSFHLRSLVC